MKCIYTLSLLTALSAQAAILPIEEFPAPTDIPSGGAKKCTATILSQADIDNDGLQDLISIEVDLRSSDRLQDNVITEGSTFRFRINRIEYTLADGTRGIGRARGFTRLDLNKASALKINGQAATEDLPSYKLQPKGSTLKIQAAKGETVSINNVAFNIEVDPENPNLNRTGSTASLLIRCLLPISLLFLRRGKPGTPKKERETELNEFLIPSGDNRMEGVMV